MNRVASLKRSPLLHGAGLIVLASAWPAGRVLARIGLLHAGHEPASVYLLALLVFLLTSAGTALTAMGPRLFRKVVVADRWAPHVPSTFREHAEGRDRG